LDRLDCAYRLPILRNFAAPTSSLARGGSHDSPRAWTMSVASSLSAFDLFTRLETARRYKKSFGAGLSSAWLKHRVKSAGERTAVGRAASSTTPASHLGKNCGLICAKYSHARTIFRNLRNPAAQEQTRCLDATGATIFDDPARRKY
jgi:hypothetical protein